MACHAENILCMHPANERQPYSVAPSLMGWVHIQRMIPAMNDVFFLPHVWWFVNDFHELLLIISVFIILILN